MFKKTRETIFSKIFSGYLLIALGLAVLVLFFSFRTIKSYYLNTLTNDLKDLCVAIDPQALSLIKSNNFPELDRFVKKLDVQTHKRITIIDVNGAVIADSEKDPKTMPNHGNRPEVMKAISSEMGTSIRYSTTVQEDMLYMALPIKDNGRTIGVVRASMFLKDVNALLKSIIRHISYITLVVLIFSLIFAFMFSRNLSVPIGKLKDAAQKIASGDFNIKVTLDSKNELRDLAGSFNYMANKINDLFSELSQRKDELATVINSIMEGLLVIDTSGKIKFSNDSFKTIMQNRNIEGRFYWEVVRINGFKELIENTKSKQVTYTGEVEILDRSYSISIVPIATSKEYLVVLHDITDIKNLETKKKELIANVSHELRTPLTAIKGFVETLEDETTQEGKRYLGVINKHTERLISIVEDLLLLSQLEEKSFKLEINRVNLKETIANILKIFEGKAKNSNISIKSEIPDNIQPINADPFRIEQMFINLIDNAIKYTDKGGINIVLKQDDRQTTIIISDTGIGIAKEHFPYIFERFYVVDKSRSRKLGGTGLGLAIVKHIVMLHNGTINVESILNSGTSFTITLPRL